MQSIVRFLALWIAAQPVAARNDEMERLKVKMRAAFDSAALLWQGAPALGLAQLPPNTYLAIFAWLR